MRDRSTPATSSSFLRCTGNSPSPTPPPLPPPLLLLLLLLLLSSLLPPLLLLLSLKARVLSSVSAERYAKSCAYGQIAQ